MIYKHTVSHRLVCGSYVSIKEKYVRIKRLFS
jgi:hypothetical protein